MRIGMYPFAGSMNIGDNLRAMDRAVGEAAASSVGLLVFHECSLCGYPKDKADMEQIRPEAVEQALQRLAEAAKARGLYIAVGAVRFEGNRRYNSILLLDDRGEIAGHYNKQALWGWDTDRFERGTALGLFSIDGVNVGFRICYDIRFPELFRELYRENADLCLVSFADTEEKPNPERYQILKSHLITRAVENVMTVASVNSIDHFQTAPTIVVGPGGQVLLEGEPNKEQLLVFDYEKPDLSFGMKGIVENAWYFMESKPF